jgi:hypothetical protein
MQARERILIVQEEKFLRDFKFQPSRRPGRTAQAVELARRARAAVRGVSPVQK